MLADARLLQVATLQAPQMNCRSRVNQDYPTRYSSFDLTLSSSGSVDSEHVARWRFSERAATVGSLALALLSLYTLPGSGGSGVADPPTKSAEATIEVSPSTVTLPPGGNQKFVATVAGSSDASVKWSVSLEGSSSSVPTASTSPGVINEDGFYTAPTNVAATTTVDVRATSVALPNAAADTVVTVSPSGIMVSPATATLTAGAKQAFTAVTTGLNPPSLQWSVNGVIGGGPTWGVVSPQGIYTAPAIDPGITVTISAASVANSEIKGEATVGVVNPPTPALTGATYAKAFASWESVLLPRVEDRSGLVWDEAGRTWSPNPNWSLPAVGIGPQIYYLEPFLRPATCMAIARQDIPLMEELAQFHMALLQQRTTTLAEMLSNAPANAIIYIDGPPDARTFPWYEPYSGTQIRIREDEQSNAQYLSVASRLLRAIAEMPAVSRTPALLQFAQGFSGFLVSEQLLRMLYGTTPWSHYANPNIPQPVVAAWQFLAQTGYEPPHPLKYQAAMTDMEIWLVSDAAEVILADAAAPELGILDDETRAQLKAAVLAGVSLMQARCHHSVSPDGADVLSAFAGDFDDHPNYAYTGDTEPEVPTTPNPKPGLSWDIEGAYRLPIIFRSLYETRSATGASFPAQKDLVALANSYVHLAFVGDSQLPAFNNFLDGWNGWFRVGDPSLPDGYPPQQFCNATDTPINCLTAGAVQGWGQLALFNPDLATLIQRLVDLAYDDSATTVAFKDQHYWYDGPYTANADLYPWLLIYVVGDSAERLP